MTGYARVSKRAQDTALQLDALEGAGCQKIFQEKLTGAREDRPELAKALAYLRRGDCLVVWKLERLGRNMRHLLEVVAQLQKDGIDFRSLTEAIDTTTPAGKLVFHFFSALGEFERDRLIERTNAGLAAAAARGRKGGRPRALSPEKLARARALLEETELNVGEVARRLKVGRTTLYDALRADGAAAPPPA